MNASPPATGKTAKPPRLAGPREFLTFLLLLGLGLAAGTSAQPGEEPRVSCSPRSFQVLPGEPVRVEFTVEAATAAPVRWQLPASPLLALRAVENIPVQRTASGAILHRRAVLWQGLEPGTVKLNALSVETRGRKLVFPEITVTIRDPG